LLVLVLDECSLESPLGELSFDDDERCSRVVVAGSATTIGGGAATTIGAGATTTGAGYTETTGGAGAVVVVSLVVFELVVSVCANPTATLPNSTATPKAKAAFFDECFIMISVVLLMAGSIQRKVALIQRTRTLSLPNAL
jgi:hypothetical protein